VAKPLIPPEHLRAAEEILARGFQGWRAWRELAASHGLTDLQASAAIDAAERQKLSDEKRRDNLHRAAGIFAFEAIIERIHRELAKDDLQPRDIKALVDAAVKAHAHLDRKRGHLDPAEDREMQRKLGAAKLAALEKAAASGDTRAEIVLRWPEDSA
jgi:hypothetical protein